MEANGVKKDVKSVVLVWKNICVRVKKEIQGSWWEKKKFVDQQILNNVSGICKSGRLLAIMGASGSGKSTLLATLSHRIKHEQEGEILVNGRPVSKEMMVGNSGFSPQQDFLVDSLTVSEHLKFMSKLVMDRKTRSAQRQRRIYWLITKFGLSKCTKTQLRHLSGGELKRVGLAVQLLTDPPLLFCDEPTSGLDSYSASNVIEHLSDLVKKGKAVICTIHQPASGVFELFHDVLLLADGRLAYYGSVSEAANYFKSLDIICPNSFNDAEFYVQQLAVFPGKEEECRMRNQYICNIYAKSDKWKQLEFEIQMEMNKVSSSLLQDDNHFSPHYFTVKPNFWVQTSLLTWRSFIQTVRNSGDLILRFALFMLIAVLITVPFIDVTDDLDQNGIQNMQGFLYLIITETVFTYSYSVFHTFPAEVKVLLRESSSGLYYPGSYYLSKMIITLPKTIIEVLIYALFIFLTANLRGGLFGCMAFCLVVVVTAISATAFGTLMSAAFEDISTASLLSVPIEMLGVIFCGTFVQLIGLTPWLSWIRYFSQFYYGQEAVSILQWHFIDKIECPDDPKLPCFSNGDQVLLKYGYHRDNFLWDFFGLILIYVLTHLAGFWCLRKRSRQQSTY